LKEQPDKVNLAARLLLAVLSFLPMFSQTIAFGGGAGDDSGGPWAQWRGRDGLGVSSERDLPEVWSSDGHNIRWKTELPGQGNSSPVVSNGRVILTTAYKSRKAATWQKCSDIVSCVLAVVFIAGGVGGLLRKRGKGGAKDEAFEECASIRRFNFLFRWITSLVFIGFVLVTTVGRRYSGAVFGGIGFLLSKFGLLLSKLGYEDVFEDMMHLFSMDEGVPAAVWLTGGGIGLLGFAAAVGWIRAHSIWRVLGAAAVLPAGIGIVKLTPLDQWKEQIELWEKLTFVLPGFLVAFWHLLNYIEIGVEQDFESEKDREAASAGRTGAALHLGNRLKIRCRHKNILRIGRPGRLLLAGLLAALSLLVFIPPNFYAARLGMQRSVLCIDIETGVTLWEAPIFVGPAERKHRDGTYATPTAATDGTYIIVNFGVGVAGLDFDGRVLWRQWDSDYIKNSRYGAAASPVLLGRTAIVIQESEYDSERSTWIAAFDKQTGEIRWEIYPEDIYQCFATPLLYRRGDAVQLIVASWGNVSSYDAESGKCLWVHAIPTEQLVASPARWGNLLCVGGGTWGPSATIMIDLDRAENSPDAAIVWESEKDTPEDCSPVIYGGLLFTLSDRGKMTCYDAANGRIFWNRRLKGSRYLSSLVAGDGKVYACNTKGLTTVIAAERKFRKLAENDLGGRCYASPAIADGRILLRVGEHLYCIENKGR